MTNGTLNEGKTGNRLYFSPETIKPEHRITSGQREIPLQLKVVQYASGGLEINYSADQEECPFGTTHAGRDYVVRRLYAGLNQKTASVRAVQQLRERIETSYPTDWTGVSVDDGQRVMREISDRIIRSLDELLVQPEALQNGVALEKVPDKNYLFGMAWKPVNRTYGK